MLQQAEYLGDAGKIEESERVNEEVQKLRRSKEDLITLAENPTMVAKQMKVCEICGAMQATNDTEKRNQTHLEGKLHIGFSRLRSELEKLKKRKEVLKLQAKTQRAIKQEEFKKKGEDKSEKVQKERRDDKERERRDGKERDREREKERDRDERKKEKERKRSKDRDRSRDRHRDRSRDKSRDRKRARDESEGRDRDRERDRKEKKKDKKEKKGKKSSRSRSRD